MRNRATATDRLSLMSLFVLVFLAATSTLHATIHVIGFGGSIGNAYSPSSLSVSVGDTVRWQGNFSFHPLSSVTVPPGAQTWHNDSGTTFDYVVKVAGSYTYQCDVHEPSMAGSITASVTSVTDRQEGLQQVSFRLEQNYPNPFNPSTSIRYGLPHNSQVSVVVYNTLGQLVATLVQGDQEAGYHEVRFDASGLSSGVYIYRLSAGQLVQARKLMLLR